MSKHSAAKQTELVPTTPGETLLNSLAPIPEDLGGEDILSQSMVIPRLHLMQGLSEMVSEGKAQMGDIVRSTNGEKLGNGDKPVDFIPITFTNTWVLSEMVGQKYEYRSSEPMTAKNQDLPWEFESQGTMWKRTKSLNLFAILVNDALAEKAERDKAAKGEMPDPDKALMPVLISFRSSSYAAGKEVVTHFAKARKFNLPGLVSVLQLSCTRTKNEKGTFYVYGVKNVGKTPPDLIEVANYWKSTLATKDVVVDSEESEEVASVGGGSQF